MLWRSSFAALVALGVFGLILIWKGMSGDVMTTPLGGPVIPRWMYIGGGLALLAFPGMYFLTRSESGRSLLGL
jgi:hypothetical protein